MLTIKKQYIRNQKDEIVAVVLDVETFRKIEELMEDLADIRIVEERADEEDLDWETVKYNL